MKRHVKPRRTQTRGLRSYSGSGVELFSSQKIEGMGEVVKKILADCTAPSKEVLFVLSHIRIVCLFRQAKNDMRKRDALLRMINKSEENGHQLGIKVENIRLLNRWIVDQELVGKLDWLLQQIQSKRRERE